MFSNYFKVAVRNLLRYKGFSAINISSLTLGVLACLLIGLFVADEWKYDKTIPEGENVFRVYNQKTDHQTITYQACVPPAYATFLQRQYPEVDTTARILMSLDKFLVEAGEKKAYENKGWFVDASFFEIFPLAFISGDPATALREPGSIVISRVLAQKYFGSHAPIGKTLLIDKSAMTIKGVFDDLPDRFHLDFNFLMSLPSAGIEPARMEQWTWDQFYTYVKLKPGSDVSQLEDKFQAHVKKEIYPTLRQEGSTFLPFFQQLENIHLQSSNFIYDNAIRGNETTVKALAIIAVFVLLIACFNFINLSTARSLRRSKEIGVRKVIGAARQQLVIQFIGETVLISMLSVLLAAIATMLVLPYLNGFTGKSISFNPFTNPLLALLILAGGILLGMIAGLYPAVVLSGFDPIVVLKNFRLKHGGSHLLRQGLILIQFTLSALLIVAAIIVYRQTSFLNSKDLGFDAEQVVYFQMRDSVETQIESFKSELKRSPNVVSVTSGYGLPGDRFAGDGVTVPDNGGKEFAANVFIGDHDYAKTLGLRIIAGRDFSRDMSTDVNEAFLINETAVKELGFGTPEQAIGRRLHWDKWTDDSLNTVKKGKVIGVVKDFHYKSLHEKITSSVIQIFPPVSFMVAVKLKSADLKNTLSYINEVWNRFAPGYPLDYNFMDETYGKMYKAEEKLSTLLLIFTIMAIVVGCMGLFGLVVFSVEQRIKEIGIRKVLGASSLHLVGLLSQSFLKLVLIASLIAFPIAWWAAHDWLAAFPYRIEISWWIFVIAALLSLSIAFLTISIEALKAAIANPVKSLRTE